MTEKSTFQFMDHLITKSVFVRRGGKTSEDFDTEITASGIINEEEKIFQLSLGIELTDPEDNFLITVEAIGFFKFSGELKLIEKFLFLNAPAILFPYLRAYIASVTALSGLDTITIPTMNLTSMKEDLQENVSYIPTDKERVFSTKKRVAKKRISRKK